MKINAHYQAITDRIIAALERGTPPWHRPWTATPIGLPRRHNNAPYQGINILALWDAAEVNGFISNRWMTYRQATELGGHVRKGERSTTVFFAKPVTRTETDVDGTDTDATYFVHKAYNVFNADQIDELPSEYYPQPANVIDEQQRNNQAEAFFKNTGSSRIEHGQNAFYSPSKDQITMPEFTRFHTANDYYATLAHEHIHWTGHSSRLNRDGFTPDRSKQDYAFEELIAEIGAAFVCAHLGITPSARDNHASYIAQWLQHLNQDPKALFRAASKAQIAADHLLRLQVDSAAAA